MEFEEYDSPRDTDKNGSLGRRMEARAAWFKDSEGNLVGVVRALPS